MSLDPFLNLAIDVTCKSRHPHQNRIILRKLSCPACSPDPPPLWPSSAPSASSLLTRCHRSLRDLKRTGGSLSNALDGLLGTLLQASFIAFMAGGVRQGVLLMNLRTPVCWSRSPQRTSPHTASRPVLPSNACGSYPASSD